MALAKQNEGKLVVAVVPALPCIDKQGAMMLPKGVGTAIPNHIRVIRGNATAEAHGSNMTSELLVPAPPLCRHDTIKHVL